MPFPDYRFPVDLRTLLHPYIEGLSGDQLAQVATYIDLLLRWNLKTNLTAIRDSEQIATRHFGESFFFAGKLLGSGGFQLPITNYKLQILDLGSGAGFPAIPLLIYRPDVTLTLIEAHHTKAVFLREVLRALSLQAEVKNVRAESLPAGSADLVTFRAVEKFDSILPAAARLVRSSPNNGCPTTADSSLRQGLGLLLSSNQIERSQKLLPYWKFQTPIPIPNTRNRVIQFVEPNS